MDVDIVGSVVTRQKSVGHSVIILSVGSVISSLALAIRGLIIARTIGPEGYGDFVLALTFAGTFIYGFIMGMDVIIPRELSRDSSVLYRLLPSVMTPAFVWSVVLVLIINIIGSQLAYSNRVLILLAFTAPMIAMQALSALLNSVYRGLDRMDLDAAFRILDGILGLILAGVVVLLTRSIYKTTAVSLAATALVLFTSLYLAFRLPVTSKSFDSLYFRNLMSAALPIGLAVFVSQGGQNISMLALGRLSSSREVGFYGAALGIAMMSRPLQMAYASAFLPRLSKQASEMSDKPLMSYGSGLRFALVFGTPIGIATAMLAPLLISIFYGQQFVEGNHALRVLGVATILLFLNAYLWQVHAALGNQRNVLITSVISILVVIGFSFLLIPPFGIVGAALAFVCREGVQALIFIMILHRRWRTVALRHQSVTSIVLASLAMAACLWSVRFSTNWTALIFLLAAVIVYCMVLLISGGIERGELRRLIPGEFSSFLAARRSKE